MFADLERDKVGLCLYARPHPTPLTKGTVRTRTVGKGRADRGASVSRGVQGRHHGGRWRWSGGEGDQTKEANYFLVRYWMCVLTVMVSTAQAGSVRSAGVYRRSQGELVMCRGERQEQRSTTTCCDSVRLHWKEWEKTGRAGGRMAPS